MSDLCELLLIYVNYCRGQVSILVDIKIYTPTFFTVCANNSSPSINSSLRRRDDSMHVHFYGRYKTCYTYHRPNMANRSKVREIS